MVKFFRKQEAQTGNSMTGAVGAETTLNKRENQKIRKSMGKFKIVIL